MDRALELDPLSTIVRYTRIWEFVLARRFAQAEAAAEQLFAEDSSFVPALTALVHIAERRGDYPRAIRLQTGLERAQWGGSEFARRLRRGYEAGGAGGYWQVQLETSLARARTMRVTATWLAGVYANLGRKEEALQWLERAVVMREGDVMYLNEDSFFDPLRDAPRFQNVIRSVGLTPKPAPVAGVNE
jgi:tetratricopeptide (TPR) repeat protein